MKKFNEEIESVARSFNRPPIYDGVVNEKEYMNSNTKILWVLKDANSSVEESYDLRGAINDLKTDNGIKKGWEKTFNNIIYVTYGILNQAEWDDIPFPKDRPDVADVLKKIAYINVKKVGGGSESIDSELYEHYNKSKQLLFDQIEEFNPDVVIFGNTYRFFEKDLGLNHMNIFGSCHATAKKNRIYINAYHPNARIKGKQYFEDIIKAYNAFRKQIMNLHSDESLDNDIKLLKDKTKDIIEHLGKVKMSLISERKYDKLVYVKELEQKLDNISIDIDKIEYKSQ